MTLVFTGLYLITGLFAYVQVSPVVPDSSQKKRPVVTTIVPEAPVGSNDLQWISLRGLGFSRSSELEFATDDFSRVIEQGHRIRFVSASELRAHVRFGADADQWTVRIVGPDTSEVFSFFVAAPTPSLRSVTGPYRLEDAGPDDGRRGITVEGSGFSYESWILVDGHRIRTRPVPSSDNPYAFVQTLRGISTEATLRRGAQISVLTEGTGESNILRIGKAPIWRRPLPWTALAAGIALLFLSLYLKARQKAAPSALVSPRSAGSSPATVVETSEASEQRSLPPPRSPTWSLAPSEQDTFERRLYEQAREDLDAGLLSVGRLVETMRRSRADLSREIKDLYGEAVTPKRYLQHIKMTEAAARLDDGSPTVASVAKAVGYRNASKFTKAFRAFHGLTPIEYRDRGVTSS